MVTIVGLALLLSGLAPQSAAGVEPTNTLSITPTVDTYVRMDRPSSSYGSQASLRVDGEPVMQSSEIRCKRHRGKYGRSGTPAAVSS